MVMGDPTRSIRIMMNICTNAFHAMEESGLLEHQSAAGK